MSDAAGKDNPAFASEDECGSKTENGGQQQVTLDQDRKSSSADCAPIENGQRSFISQHYVEPIKANSESCYKTETRIELPAENTEKSVTEPKLNGVHGNGNNNDASFLNNSTTSIQVNESGKKEQIEAVNLELVSMRPYTGNNIQTKGQEASEVSTDPYEEYFVPVNEHRKYIRGPEAEVETTVAGVRFDLGPGVGREGLSLRDPAAGLVDYSHWLTALRGEKLYVTKDKRSRNSYWKQLLCGFTIFVVVIAMIIIILAATGVIFTQEPTEPLENVKENSHQFDINVAQNQEFLKNPPSSPPPLTSTFPPWPTTDETLDQIIPDALNGILRLDDFNWSDDLNDTKSRVYREITAEIEEHLGNILQRENSKSIIKVYNINNKGEIKFRISHPPMNIPEENQEYIEKALRKNRNMIGQYHLSRLQVEKLIDQCEHGNLQCAENCKYDYSIGIFICICSSEKMLDQDGKTCVDNDLSNVKIDDVMLQSSTESIHDFVQGRSRDPNTAQFEIKYPNTWENPDFKTGSIETEISISEPKTKHDHSQLEQKSVIVPQSESTPTTKHIFENDNFYWNHEHSHHEMETTFEESAEPKSTAEPESTIEPTVKPQPTTKAGSTVEQIIPPEFIQPKLNVESELIPEPVSEFPAKSEIIPKSEFITEAESITEKETATEPVSVTESTTIDETDDDTMSTIEPHFESNTEISNQSESVKSTSYDVESTQISYLDYVNTTNISKSFADLLHENNNSKIDKPLITTIKTNENPIDDNVSLQVIPLTSKNKSIDINNNMEIKTELTTMQSYTNKDDKISESTTIEASFTTLNYKDLKENSNDNILPNKSRNYENLNMEQFTQSSGLQEEKENDSTTEINVDVLSNDTTIKEFDESTATTTMSIISIENRTELIITKTTFNDKYSHTIEINDVSNKNQKMYNNSKIYETTMIPETTSIDMSTQLIFDDQKIYVPEFTLQSDTQDSNEKNVIEHMPTTVFPKVPKNFAHNVEPLKEAITKPAEDEHIMLIPKSEQPVEIHAIIPQLIPEQSIQSTQNKSLKTENSTEINNRVVINEDLSAKKSIKNIYSIDSSTVNNDKNIIYTGNNGYTIHPDEIQHSTNHPLHPAILPENSVNHFAGKFDVNDDRHIEDMSPFLPDIHKEKENAKKAPRLDKDEQDVPNPFETHIDDVITYRPLIHNADDLKHKVNETKTKDLLNDVNLQSINNEKKIDSIEKTIKTNVADNVKNIIKNNLNMSEIINDTETKIHNILNQDNNFAKSNNITKDKIVNQENNNSSAMKENNNEALKMTPISESAKVTTTIAKKKVENLEDSVIESGTTSLEKPEENAVEDQYNDITDESLSKGYGHDVGKIIPIKVVEESKKTILNDINAIQISYNNVPSPMIISDIKKEKNETNINTTQSLLNTTIKDVLEKQMEDARLTTQEPVLPMEIQQEMSTTIGSDKIEITTVSDNDKQEENNTEQSNIDRQFDEREVDKITHITTTQFTLETKTTAQVPILPEELQTTENDMLTTTSMTPNEEKEMNQGNKTKLQNSTKNIKNETKTNVTENITKKENITSIEIEINNSTSSEKSMTTMYKNNVSVGSDREHVNLNDENINDPNKTIENSTESTNIETTLMISATEKSVINGIERTLANDVTTTEDVRPVTEILDDTQPEIKFDYAMRMLFTTPKPISIEPEFSEEALRVIPLEKSQEIKKKLSDKKGFDKYKYKKEKDLSLEEQNENALMEKSSSTILSQTEPSKIITKMYEEPNDSIVDSDLDPSTSKFNLFDRKSYNLPILFKNTGNIDESSNIENKEIIAETKPKNYPSFIPVSEEIKEPVPVTEPYIVMRNYTRPIIVTSFKTEESNMNKTAIEDRINDPEMDLFHIHVKANEMIEQSVTFFPDQLFDVTEEIDRVTKEPSTIQLTDDNDPTTLNIGVENATTAASISFSESTPNAILSKCINDEFQCVNGTSRNGAYCVPLSAKCDSKNDCSDGSDELNCEDCSGNFRCANGQCLKRHFVCNKIIDCNDGSDEHDCENWKCQSDEFRCPSGRCIPVSWQCDGRLDCEEHRDEYNCSKNCKDNQYLCPTEKWCIPQTWRCNGISECVNGEDEKLCDCSLDQFKCQTGGCIPWIQTCDGVKNCPDYSDEWNCLITNITAKKNINAENNMTNELSDRVPLLKIRQYDNDYRLVCSDGWSEEFSDSYCQTLGFAGAETTKIVQLSEKNGSEKILRLKTNPNHRLPLITNLEQVEICVSNKVVQVSCQEFSCGLHYAEGPPAKLTGETPVSDRQWFNVALLKELKHGIVCTASILGPMHALTSYSCIYRYRDSNRWQLFAGGNMLKGISVKNIVPYHPQVKYNQFLYDNDIALIELEEPLVFSRNISAVCLPRQSIQPKQICVTVGWGFSMNGEIDLQQYLKFLPSSTYDSDKCNATNYPEFITEHNICAELIDTDKGPCYNDAGAPLMCASESQGISERWEIQGLLSYHSRCSRGHPAIYSSLEPALSWLRKSVPALQMQS